MLDRVHEHIVSELQQSARTDTIFVVTAVIFNLVVLGANSGVAAAAAESRNAAGDIILAVLIVMSLLVNGISITALYYGRATRDKLLGGLLAMYRDNEVDQYYDSSLLLSYRSRYLLFAGIILCLAAIGIVIPLILRAF